MRPDGVGLPVGSGDVLTGEEVYCETCAVCHGEFGEAVGRWPALAGGQGTLESDDPNKTIGSYWPYLSNVYDYIYRAMPFGNAHSLTPDDVYGITAYLLYMNDLVDEDFTLSNENFTSFMMPNEPNFLDDDRDTTEVPAFTVDVCMENFKPSDEITAKAAVVNVTPDDAAARAKVQAAAAAARASEVETPQAEEPATEQATQSDGDAALVAEGENLFKICKACHAVGDGAKNRVGPELNGVVGRAAASVDGFKYSNAMQAMGSDGAIWT